MSQPRVVTRTPNHLVRENYQALQDLLGQYEQLGSEDVDAKRELFARVQESLRIHSRMEEAVFYRRVAEMKEKTARERVGVALQEHRMAEALIAALSRATPRENRFDAIMRLLSSHIDRLREQDEVYIIPLAAKLPGAKQESLLREMEDLRERLQKEKVST